MRRKRTQATKPDVRPFNARLPKDLHTQAMVYRARTGMSLTAQVIEALRRFYAQREREG